MSRGQENQVINESQQQNATAANNAQTSYNNAQNAVTQEQGDIGTYEQQLAQFAAANPYGQGGQYQTSQNQVLSNTADAAAQAAGEAMQSQAVRTGQNAGGAIAGTEATEQANERNLASQEATANAQRIGAGAQYDTNVNAAESKVPGMENEIVGAESNLTGQQLNAENEALKTQEAASQMPSFGEDLFNGVMQAGQAFAGAYGKALGGCWIAARLFGGWNDPRTKKVRFWIFGPFAETWYGAVPAALYARFGERVADRWMPRSPLLTWALRKLFEAALRRAEKWEKTEDGYAILNVVTEGR